MKDAARDFRLQWCQDRSARYLEWAGEVARGPFSPEDKLEFAIISAHTPQSYAIAGFLATRFHFTRDAVYAGLRRTGVFAPGVKAQRIVMLRRRVRAGELGIPKAPFKEWREKDAEHHIEGLGICKLSFGLALSAPLESDVVCLDTHLCREYGVPFAWTRRLANYASVEARLRGEARVVGLPPFAYQWAVWDYVRLRDRGQAPDDHSFLWQGGARQTQPALF